MRIHSLHLRRATCAAFVAGALVAAGCGEKTLDTGDAEDKISDSIFEQRNVRVDVNCPDDMKAKKGETYRCELEEGGQQLGVTITMTDDDGGFRFKVDEN
jgi:DNA-binding transcriptional regulator WhiA